MQIFISWSGQLSKELGEIFSNWIPSVLQFVRPYFTPDDIEKGSRWGSEIAKELQESQVGIMMLTRDNLSSPWIMFEAGALSKQLEKSKICPILFGLENTDLVGPLVQFQSTAFTKVDMKKLVKTINNACDDNRLEDNVLDNVFEMWWPKLDEPVSLVMGKVRDKADTSVRTDRDLVEEILSLTRMSVVRPHREVDEYLSLEAKEQLYMVFNELKRAITVNDITKIGACCQEMEAAIGFIGKTLGTPLERQEPTMRRMAIERAARKIREREIMERERSKMAERIREKRGKEGEEDEE